MIQLLLAFLTGLTTGGLSCLAVQGGLLASSLAGQIEKDVQAAAQKPAPKPKSTRKYRSVRRKRLQTRLAAPILAFLLAKLAAYTVLGFLLGLVGQVFQLTPATRAVLLIAIGVFMLGSALRMLDVHPIFRFFAFEPPAFIRRKLRRTAAASDSASLAAPALLGLLTVLIPCGVTQAMMAAAISTGSPIQGAALMFAFTLGASPTFFAVAYFATQLGARLEKNFMRIVAVVVLLLAVVTIDSGVTLAGSPVSLTRLVNDARASAAAPSTARLQAAGPQPSAETAAEGEVSENVVTVNVLPYGYEPNVVHAKADEPVRLRLVSQNVYSCSLAFVIPSLKVQAFLPETGETYIDIPPQEAGTQMPFMCSMGMFTGTIIFDL